MISAFLETGSFELQRHHLASDMVVAWRRLWDFCVDYQVKSGCAPPLSLVRIRFPDFELTPDISVEWAADNLRKAAALRQARTQMGIAAMAAADEDLSGVFEALEAVERPHGFSHEPASIFDHSLLEERFDLGHIEVPWPTLNRLSSGGIAKAELWYVAARFSNGKTFSLCRMAARAAEVGMRVGYASLEMPSAQITERILAGLCGTDSALFARLTGDDIGARKQAQDQLMARTPGSVSIYDPHHGSVNTIGHITDMCADYEVVFLDHVGLMRNSDGKRAIEDWRTQAAISNQLRELTLDSGTSVVAAAQINRAGEVLNSPYPPKAKDLAQSDALGQDADVVITQKKLSRRVLVQGAEKMRNGATGRWWARFDPARNRFNEVSFDDARALMDDDESVF